MKYMVDGEKIEAVAELLKQASEDVCSDSLENRVENINKAGVLLAEFYDLFRDR
jgi:hypothetical protein